ncbi:MAG: ParB/RepB/Spo0J family partition protein [Parvularcula sp.]|jgi:ParB family chromosome partitioning protein|nr:ParB/RepB/Spo0J family partition protein [Parvularcula sp.]
MTMAKKGLGRGLEAILGDMPVTEAPTGGVRELALTDITPDKDQPRKSFSEDELEALASSMRQRGVLQPILVRTSDAQRGYTIIAGERRWRAAQRAGLHKIPALIKEVEPGISAELALIENVQRVDLNPIEEADAYEHLRERHGRSAGEIAEAVGKSRSHVANMLRLTALPDEVRAMVIANELSMGHARALLSADDPLATAKRVVKEGLSVRATEKLVARPTASRERDEPLKKVAKAVKDADTRALEKDLADTLGMSVDVSPSGKGGTLTIRYDNLDQLDDLCRRLMGSAI